MIRRESPTADSTPHWLLISQVEHARVSGELAAHCLSHLDAEVRDELQSAIKHHDDGWAAWDARMPLDTEHRRPWGFHELPLELSLPIWTASIDAARFIGPLAGLTVAGHFLALLDSTEKVAPEADVWRAEMNSRRAGWFTEWRALNPQRHNKPLADQGLKWLQLLDVLSLWLCNVCPGEGQPVEQAPAPYQMFIGESLETKFSCFQGHVSVSPWCFDVPDLQLTATGWMVPVAEYDHSDALLATRAEQSISWNLKM